MFLLMSPDWSFSAFPCESLKKSWSAPIQKFVIIDKDGAGDGDDFFEKHIKLNIPASKDWALFKWSVRFPIPGILKTFPYLAWHPKNSEHGNCIKC